MSKHTPGPWISRRCANSEYDVRAEGFGVVANSIFRSDIEGDEAIVSANSRLIAAAPDLVEALKGMLRVCPRVRKGMVSAEYDAARAAIAKATGAA